MNIWLTRIRAQLVPLSLLLMIPLLNVFYSVLNHGGRGASSLVTDLDQAIPFVKAFIVPYLIWYPFIIWGFVYMCIKDRNAYYRTLFTYAAGLIVCYVVYYLYQTTVPRPVLTGTDPFTRLVAFTYASDQPFNCFPSIHVLSSYLIMIGMSSSQAISSRIRWFVHIMGGLIILSTLLVKQHVILDAAGAILLAEVLFLTASQAAPLVERFYQANGERWLWRKKPYSLSTTKRKY
jgi:membrane-associated phospholipid phosphatase